MAAVDTIMQTLEMVWWIIKWFWWAFLVAWLFYLKIKWKKFPIEAIIYEKRGENLIKTNDRAGRYQDPYTKTIGYKLQKAGDTIPVVNFDAVVHNNVIHTTLFERFVNLLRPTAGTIHLFRYGSKQYKPIKVKTPDGMKEKLQEIKDDNNQPIYMNIYVPFDPRTKLGVLDFEVVDWDNMNQMVQEWQTTLQRRQKSRDFWLQIAIPAMMLGVATIVVIIMIKFGYDYAVNIMSQNPQAPTPSAPAEKPDIPIIKDLIP